MPVLLQYRPHGPDIEMQEILSGARLDEVILVVPTQRRIRHLSRELLQIAGGGIAPALPIHTLETLALAVYRATQAPRRLVGGTLQTLFFDAAVRATRDSLEYFRLKGRDHRLFQGTFDRVIDVILHLKESGVTPGLLLEEAETAPLDERQKLIDVAAIYTMYDDRLDAAHAVDPPGVFVHLHRACPQEELTRAFRTVFPGARRLSLAGFDEFTLPEIGFVRKLSGVDNLSLSILFDFQHGNRQLFGHLEDNYARLIELGFREEAVRFTGRPTMLSVVAPVRHPSSAPAVDHLSRHLFGPAPATGRPDLRHAVSVIRTPGRTQEVEWICRQIRSMAAADPTLDLSSICVAMARPQAYTDIVRERFRRFGIPVNVTDRYDLSRSPVVVAAIGVLQMVVSGFRRTDVLRTLSSSYLGFSANGRPVDVPNLSEVSRELRIKGGTSSWLSRIDRVLERLAAGSSGLQQESTVQIAASLQRAREDLTAIVELARGMAQEGTASELSERFRAVLDALGLGIRLIDRPNVQDPEQVERDVRAYTRFLEVLDETVGMLEEEEGAGAVYSLRSFTDRVRVAISRERYNVRERFGRGVLVTSIDETRGLRVKVMIVAGLVDGEFPSVYHPEVFLSAARQTIREKRHEWQDRYLFYQAVTNWSGHLYLTYPERDGELELVRSSFVDSVLTIADVDQRSAADELPVLCTLEEVLRWQIKAGAGAPTIVPDGARESLAEVRRVAGIERSRLRDHLMPEYEGHVREALRQETLAALDRFRTRVYSVSQLETYAECPFRFFAERVLRLNTREVFREDLSPLERGSLLHEALFEFYTDRREQGLPSLHGCTDEALRDAVDRLADILAGKLAALDLPDAFWEVDRDLLCGRPGSRRGLMQDLLETERRRDVQTEPRYFEVGFGGAERQGRKDERLSRPEPMKAGTVSIRGKIDRVDVGDGFFTIVDYKTGTVIPGLNEIRSCMSLQLPLYLLAIEELIAGRTGGALEPAAGVYVQVREPVRIRAGAAVETYKRRAFGATEGGRQMVPSTKDLRAIIADCIRAVERYVDGIVTGHFPLTDPANIESVCSYCDYKTMCRIQALRHVGTREGEGL